MKKNFSKEALRIWDKAIKAARESGCNHHGPEHILVAFLESDHFLARTVAEENMVSVEQVKEKIRCWPEIYPDDEKVTADLLRQINSEANLSFSTTVELHHILLAVFGREYGDRRDMARKILGEFGVNLDGFVKKLRYTRNILRDAAAPAAASSAVQVSSKHAGAARGSSPLEKYGRDLTSLAEHRRLDPVALREKEIEDVIEILCRRGKSNPLLIGEPGVGKTAIITGLAQRIVQGDVPAKLKGIRIIELNLTSIIAGASLQGEFEKRMTTIIDTVKKERDIILFIDEIHCLVGAGGAQGLGDAANILKSPLVEGDIHCIGATTLKEYRRYIEKDAALARRFQTVDVREPSMEETVKIITSIKHLYEEFHGVSIPGDVIKRAVELAQKYIKDQFLPDKAIDLVDHTCAHVALLNKEEKKPEITLEDVAQIVSNKTRIPLEKVTSNRLQNLLNLEQMLGQRVVGQEEAISKVADIVRLTKSRLDLKPVRPDGVFLFIGPTGVGKTELARALAEALFDEEGKMIRLDMSEYMEQHSVSKIIGSPPGYIGSDQEGGLTGRVRTDPYSIILLDELEKAHPDVLNIFLQVFEDGLLTDSQGRTVFFSNSTIIMTSNVGAGKVFNNKRVIGFSDGEDHYLQDVERQIYDEVRKHFPPEFLNRIDEIIYFRPLGRENIKKIAMLKLADIVRRFTEENKEIVISDDVLGLVSEMGYKPEYGARYLNRTLEDMILKPLSKMVITRPNIKKFTISVNNNNISITGEGELH